MKNQVSQKTLKSLHNGIVLDCLRNGITDPNQMKRVAAKAIRTIGTMSIAGIKAAATKGQKIALSCGPAPALLG